MPDFSFDSASDASSRSRSRSDTNSDESGSGSGTGSDTGSDAGSTKDDNSESGSNTRSDNNSDSGSNTGSDANSESGSNSGTGSNHEDDEVVEEEVVSDDDSSAVEEEEVVEDATERALPISRGVDLEAGEGEKVEGGVRFLPVQKRKPKEDDGSNPCVSFLCCLVIFSILTAVIAAPLNLMESGGGKTLQAQPNNSNTESSPVPPILNAPTAAPIRPLRPTVVSVPSPTRTPVIVPTQVPVAPTPTRVPGPTNAPTNVNLGQFLQTFLIPKFGEDPFQDPISATYKAAEHMASNDPYIFQGPVSSEEELGDRYASTTLYYSLNGENWEFCSFKSETCFSNNWLEGDHCTWAGITCNENKRVTDIDFSAGFTGGSTEGSIPSAISLLTELEEFRLNRDDVTGFLPDEFLGLTNLRVLDLTSLKLNGAIPRGLGELTALENLLLAENSFSGTVPNSLGDLLSLKSLTLDGNAISGTIPSKVCDLGLGNLTSSCASSAFLCPCCTSCS